jgi:hypothetical protein
MLADQMPLIRLLLVDNGSYQHGDGPVTARDHHRVHDRCRR